MHAVVSVTDEKQENTKLVVTPGQPVSVGRATDSRLRLYSLAYSRFHCILDWQGERLVVTDLKSCNGTYVKRQDGETYEPVKRQALSQGDVVRIGKGPVKLVVEELSEVRPVAPDEIPLDAGPATQQRVLAVDRDAETRVGLPMAPPRTGHEPSQESACVNDAERVRRDFAALYQMGSRIHAQVGSDRLLDVVVDTLLGAVQAERGLIVLADPASGALRPAVARTCSDAERVHTAPVSLPLVREAMDKRLAILSSDLGAHGQARCALCAPLCANDNALGAIYLDSSSDHHEFGEHDLETLAVIARQAGLALHRAQLIDDLERIFLGTIHTLVDIIIETKDTYTYGHSKRVSEFARLTAIELGCEPDEVEQIRLAGLLHDIGKLDFSADILSNEGELTDDQKEQIRNHPQLGANIIEQIGSARLAKVQEMVRHHHEWLNGNGYPDHVEGHEISRGARILAVADSYDAITSVRPYRKTRTADEAVAELRECAGTQFDSVVVEAFVAARRKWLQGGTHGSGD